MPQDGVCPAFPAAYGSPMLPSALIGQSPEAGKSVASGEPETMWSATGLATAVEEIPARDAVTFFSVNLFPGVQTQVGRFTVDVPFGAIETSVEGSAMESDAYSPRILALTASGTSGVLPFSTQNGNLSHFEASGSSLRLGFTTAAQNIPLPSWSRL